jgi:hypothetical protein
MYAGCVLNAGWMYAGCMLNVAGCMLGAGWMYAACRLDAGWVPFGVSMMLPRVRCPALSGPILAPKVATRLCVMYGVPTDVIAEQPTFSNAAQGSQRELGNATYRTQNS